MSENLQFKVSSALKDIIGKDLISDDNMAIFELVKNSFDAHSSEVIVRFENIYSGSAKITIIDNGKGMNYDDLVNKWLFVAYSAKKDGTEDDDLDYRSNIYSKRPFAGAKGIGRFSCDRLGKVLYLETTKQEQNPKTEVLLTEWEKFESDIKKEFIDIQVVHDTLEHNSFHRSHGTMLIINELRSSWDRPKLLRLKSALAKLINPSVSQDQDGFKILLEVPEEISNDRFHEDQHNIVNGEVRNFIFEALGLKTTRISSTISSDGLYVETELRDAGRLIYRIKERNNFKLLHNLNFTLYYLNMSAKLTFTRRMGLSSTQYGHVFLYKSGFRIYPFGEPGEDPLKVNARKAQGYNRFLGNRDLIGEISIYPPNEELKETSSRGDGLIKNSTYEELEAGFWETLRRLEKYVVEVQQWGISISDESNYDLRSRASNLIAKLTGSDDIIEFETSDDFLEIIEASKANSAESIVNNLTRIALSSNDQDLALQARQAADRIKQIQLAREEAEREAEQERRRASEATTKLREKISENLFLKSINTTDFEEVISLLHHIGIYAGTIDNNLKGISLRVQNSIDISKEDLYDIIRLLSFETKKILNIVAFATKANFKLKTENKEVNIADYIREYVSNIIPSVTDSVIKVSFIDETRLQHIKQIKPIELNIVIDNLVSNARKVRATNMQIIAKEDSENQLTVDFVDNGSGISEENIKKIYDFGFTTTDGSGIGLYHVKEILESLTATIKAENNANSTGVTFTIRFKQ